MANWHDEKEPAVYAPGERQRELEALSPKPPAASDVGRLQRLAELSETKSRPGPVNADERGRALAVVLKLNGWQPSPFDPVDQELAVRDVAAALREVAKEAQLAERARILALIKGSKPTRMNNKDASIRGHVDLLLAAIEGPL